MGTNKVYLTANDTPKRVARSKPGCQRVPDTRITDTSGARLRSPIDYHDHLHVCMPPNAEKPLDIRLVREYG